jgi:hypothetical protein
MAHCLVFREGEKRFPACVYAPPTHHREPTMLAADGAKSGPTVACSSLLTLTYPMGPRGRTRRCDGSGLSGPQASPRRSDRV